MKTFTWSRVTELSDGTPVKKVEYRVYRKKRVGGEWTLVAKTRAPKWVWDEKPAGDWLFRVSASIPAGEGKASRTVRVKVKK